MERCFVILVFLEFLYSSNALTSEVSSTPTKSLTLQEFDTAILPSRTVCGTIKETPRIFGGTAVELGELPWMVALEYSSLITGEAAGIKCGGTLINQRYVLTSFNCVSSREFKVESAILGECKLSTDPDCIVLFTTKECANPVQKLKIQKIIKHDYYSARTGDNNIGLIRLDKDVVYTEFISPICLPPKNLPFPQDGKHVTVAGWGLTESGKTGAGSDNLLKVELPIVSRAQCEIKLHKNISENEFCAGGEEGKDSCQGDSGGPAIREYGDDVNQARWYQYGIVARGVGCGRAGYPAIYTRVDKYIDWIVTAIKAN